ncbi:Lnb N-terminal periplasmic domain-containing protein [Niabella drilacis]|uniref:Uncharacterized protein n=1 Tax=Niabella drilacis (strain DSM 25811 / CCM 8410 / CCUG 62505 / LMG 26954 / E90) TaxID=1285928 RepID=A0A1G6KVR4_NIADE|nr:DUF4105 domain-containing protein [Niabella drilacis]SDC35180.1 protein of unknown function [Niabella drilacis]
MIKIRLFWLLLFLTGAGGLEAQIIPGERLRISVLTCGTGDALYTSFGHTAVRIIDSVGGTDIVYNYGTFDFNDPDFYTKFTLGKLLYFLDAEDFEGFLDSYAREGRRVTEQVLHLDAAGSQRVRMFLQTNLQPANRAYRYDFLFDNCATRVRDIFPAALDTSFHFGPALGGKRLRYRQVIDQYLAGKPWQRLGIDIILGSPVDALMDDFHSMFLPDYLYSGLAHAGYAGRAFATNHVLLNGNGTGPALPLNTPVLVFSLVLLLVLAVHVIPLLRRCRKIVSAALLFITGLLGVQLLFMWFFTNHQSCAYNWNVLWAMPLNVVVVFIKNKWVRRHYFAFAIGGLIAALLVHISGIQQLPLREIAPLLAALLVIYGGNIKARLSD